MTINVNNGVTINEVLGKRTRHNCKPIINKTTGEIYASMLDAAEALEEMRRKTIENASCALEKATAKFARCKTTVERKETEYQNAIDRYSAAEKELHEAELNLLRAKGEIK